MSVSASQQVTIAAGLDEVLAVVRDVAGQPDWWPGMIASEVLEQDEAGRTVRARIVNDAKVVKDEFVVVYAHTDTEVTWQLAGPSRAQRAQAGGWQLAATTEGTEVTLTLEIDAALPLPGFVQRKVVTDTVRGATAVLKRHCEA